MYIHVCTYSVHNACMLLYNNIMYIQCTYVYIIYVYTCDQLYSYSLYRYPMIALVWVYMNIHVYINMYITVYVHVYLHVCYNVCTFCLHKKYVVCIHDSTVYREINKHHFIS